MRFRAFAIFLIFLFCLSFAADTPPSLPSVPFSGGAGSGSGGSGSGLPPARFYGVVNADSGSAIGMPITAKIGSLQVSNFSISTITAYSCAPKACNYYLTIPVSSSSLKPQVDFYVSNVLVGSSSNYSSGSRIRLDFSASIPPAALPNSSSANSSNSSGSGATVDSSSSPPPSSSGSAPSFGSSQSGSSGSSGGGQITLPSRKAEITSPALSPSPENAILPRENSGSSPVSPAKNAGDSNNPQAQGSPLSPSSNGAEYPLSASAMQSDSLASALDKWFVPIVAVLGLIFAAGFFGGSMAVILILRRNR